VADLASALEAHLAQILDGIVDELTEHGVARSQANVCAALTDLGLTDAAVRTILAMLERRLAQGAAL
jgi:hypothetical protein